MAAKVTHESRYGPRWRRIRHSLRRLLKHPTIIFGGSICMVMIVFAAFAGSLTPYDPIALNIVERLQAPSAAHLLGTDALGRDILTRIIYGARVSILVGLISILIALAFGIPLGVISAYYGGSIDSVIMRVMDALSAFPAILLALAIVSVLGPNIQNAMIAIGIVYIPAFSRIARGSVLTIKENEYVHASRASGGNDPYLMFRIILPNGLAPLLVHASLGFANAIIIEAALSFLGLGAQPPTPSWGGMLNQARLFLGQAPWYSVAVGSTIFVTVLGINLVGDGLRDFFDPRSS